MPLIRRGPAGGAASGPNDATAGSPGLSDPTAGSPGPSDATAGLAHPDPDIRWQAARAASGHPANLPALVATLDREPDRRVRDAILASLARMPGGGGVDAVLAWVRSDDAAQRTAALDALRADPVEVALRAADLLQDPDPDMRLLLCDVVRAMPSPEAARLMLALLEDESEANVCCAAIDVIAEVGDPSALLALHRCAARFGHEPFVGFSVRMAARRIGFARA